MIIIRIFNLMFLFTVHLVCFKYESYFIESFKGTLFLKINYFGFKDQFYKKFFHLYQNVCHAAEKK